jgi:dihydrofolate reductase
VTLTQYYTATTLDGFIATPDNSLDWLITRRQDEDGPLSYDRFIAEIGALAMGATTYEWILGHQYEDRELTDGSWPYDVPCWVFTHRDLRVPPGADIRFVRDDVVPIHRHMVEAAGDHNVWIVGGGDLAGQFADAGLLDELLLMIAPVTLGAGAPLLPRHVELKLEELAPNGEFATARYSIVRRPG